MNPKKFGMWIFLVTVVMLFAALTSAYIVRRADGNWTNFELPSLFWMTTVVILLSSVTMQWAYVAAKKDDLKTVRLMSVLTAILGFIFVVGQLEGWLQLNSEGIFLIGNPSGSFVFVLVMVHAVHLISAFVFVLIILRNAFRLKTAAKNILQIELCTTYWHFLGALWLYLFVFLLLTR
ncbi:MAG: cytochrome c oxidase subunit 3 [Bacteroidota bacterium]